MNIIPTRDCKCGTCESLRTQMGGKEMVEETIGMMMVTKATKGCNCDTCQQIRSATS